MMSHLSVTKHQDHNNEHSKTECSQNIVAITNQTAPCMSTMMMMHTGRRHNICSLVRTDHQMCWISIQLQLRSCSSTTQHSSPTNSHEVIR